jgi:hypothetical protein
MRLSLAGELGDGAAMNSARGDAAGDEEVSVKRQETFSLKMHDVDDEIQVADELSRSGGCSVHVLYDTD